MTGTAQRTLQRQPNTIALTRKIRPNLDLIRHSADTIPKASILFRDTGPVPGHGLEPRSQSALLVSRPTASSDNTTARLPGAPDPYSETEQRLGMGAAGITKRWLPSIIATCETRTAHNRCNSPAW